VVQRRELAGGNSLAAAYSGCSTSRLYQAAIRTASELGFAIDVQDDAAMTVSMRTAGPTATWPGHGMTAAVHPYGDGAQIVVGADRYSGAVFQMASWHQAKQLALMFMHRLTQVLPSVPEPAAPAAPPPSTVDQLKSLADLRERGLLTDDEFETEKKRVLDGG
jgi:hypothetical protein